MSWATRRPQIGGAEGDLLPPLRREGGVGEAADGAIGELHGDRGLDIDERAFLVDERLHSLRLQAGDPEQHVVDVAARVHEVTAAGEGRVGAPRGARAEDIQAVLRDDHVDETDLADRPGLDQLARFDELAIPMPLVADRQHFAGLLRQGHQLAGVPRRRRHRLLDEHVQPRFQAGPDVGAVLGVRRRDHRRIQRLRGQQFFEGRVRLHPRRRRAERAQQPLARRRARVAERRHPRLLPPQRLPRVVVPHPSRADKPDP